MFLPDGSEGSISDRIDGPPVLCIECGTVCTDLYCAVFLAEWRFFCPRHAKALARRQLRYATRKIRELTADGNRPSALSRATVLAGG